MNELTNHQCYCYGIIAIHNLLKEHYLITTDMFYDELYYLWDIYSGEAIEKLYCKMEENGKLKKFENIHLKNWE